MDNTNTADDYKKTAILISTVLHFLDPEFEYQCEHFRSFHNTDPSDPHQMTELFS